MYSVAQEAERAAEIAVNALYYHEGKVQASVCQLVVIRCPVKSTHVVKYAIRRESFSLKMLYTREPGSHFDMTNCVNAELLAAEAW